MVVGDRGDVVEIGGSGSCVVDDSIVVFCIIVKYKIGRVGDWWRSNIIFIGNGK